MDGSVKMLAPAPTNSVIRTKASIGLRRARLGSSSGASRKLILPGRQVPIVGLHRQDHFVVVLPSYRQSPQTSVSARAVPRREILCLSHLLGSKQNEFIQVGVRR